VPRIRFLLDENVSNSVIDILEARGHEVLLARDVFAAGTPDRMLAVLTAHESLVVVTHDRDFRAISKLLPEETRSRFRRGAGRIQLAVPEVDAKTHLERRLPLIELQYELCLQEETPLLAVIQKTGIRFQG
jgi:hypothetical protein